MAMPRNIGIIDLMLQIPNPHARGWYDFIKPLLMDRESRESFEMPAQYMFKDLPRTGEASDYTAYTLEQMDRHGVERAMISVDFADDAAAAALRSHPSRFVGSFHVDP